MQNRVAPRHVTLFLLKPPRVDPTADDTEHRIAIVTLLHCCPAA